MSVCATKKGKWNSATQLSLTYTVGSRVDSGEPYPHTPGLFSSRSNHNPYLSLTAVTMLPPARPPPGSTTLEGILADSGECVPCAAMKWKWRFAKNTRSKRSGKFSGTRTNSAKAAPPISRLPFLHCSQSPGDVEDRGRKARLSAKVLGEVRAGPVSTRVSSHGLNDDAWAMRQTLARCIFFSSHLNQDH